MERIDIAKTFNIDMFLKELEYIVNQDSGSKYIEGVLKIAEFFREKYEELGCFVETCKLSSEFGPCLKVESLKKDYYDVLLVGHMDTVFPQGTAAVRPFSRDKERAYGPGISDMKAGLLLAYYIVKSLKVSGMLDELSVCVLMNSDEEMGSEASTQWIKEHAARSRYALIFEPGRFDGSFVIERKGSAKYDIIFKGVAAHAGAAPQSGRCAITEMAHFVTEISKLNDYDGGTTLNPGVVSGGTAVNVIADSAFIKLGVRFRNMKEAERIRNRIVYMSQNPTIEGVDISVNKVGFREPMVSTEKTLKLFESLKSVGKQSGINVTTLNVGGASDGNGISALGIPVIDGCGPVGTKCHGEDEYMEIDSIETRLKLLLEFILENRNVAW